MLYQALKRLSKHSLVYAIGPAVHKVAGFLLIPLVTGYVGGTENYGVLGMANVIIVIASQALGVNLLSGMQRFYTRYETPEERATLITTTMTLLACTTGVALLLGTLLATPLSRLIFDSSADAPVLRLSLAILFFQLNGQVGMRYLQLREMSGTYVAVQVGKLFLEIALKVVFMVALSLEHIGALYSVLIGEMLVSLGLTGVIFSKLRYGFRWDMAKRLIRYSYPLVISGLCMFVLHQADRFLILKMIGKSETGLYNLAYQFGAMVNALLLQSFGLIWFPYIFSIHEESKICHLCRKIFTYFVLLASASSFVCALFAREMIFVMADPEFRSAWTTVPVVLFGYVFWAMYQLFQTAFFVRERTVWITVLTAMAAMVNVGLNLLFIPRFGYIGAAWATLIAFMLLAAAAGWLAERMLPVRYEGGRILAPVILGVGLYGVSQILPFETVLVTVLAKMGLVVLFPVLLVAGGYLTDKEKSKLRALTRMMRSMIRRKMRKLSS